MDPDIMELIVAMVRAALAQDGVREQTEMLDGKKDDEPRACGGCEAARQSAARPE